MLYFLRLFVFNDRSGAVYGWGKNECGQLGLNDKTDRLFPTLLKNFRSIPVSKHIILINTIIIYYIQQLNILLDMSSYLR